MKESTRIKRLHALRTENYTGAPPWLTAMLKTIFFSNCAMHPDAKKNNLDGFCIDCHQSLCSNCLSAHNGHKHLKIRRYTYSDVINRQDLCNLFDCSGIQTYNTNKAKVLFLKQRPHHQHRQQQPINFREYRCITCDRSLQDNSIYCSVACKVSTIYNYQTTEKDEDLDNEIIGNGRYLAVSLPNRRKSRKGTPLRAPMF